MNDSNRDINKGNLVLVHPMRYCFTITNDETIAVLNEETPQSKMVNHWTADGFKARVLDILEHESTEGFKEEYVKLKIFGQGRKHFTTRDDKQTKIVWIQSRLVSKCKDEGKKKKTNK
jgi:hypothetical protein